MLQIKNILKKISQGDWEQVGKNIQTRGGSFIGYAAKAEDAHLMQKAPQLLELLNKHAKINIELGKELSELLKD